MRSRGREHTSRSALADGFCS